MLAAQQDNTDLFWRFKCVCIISCICTRKLPEFVKFYFYTFLWDQKDSQIKPLAKGRGM